MSNYVISYILDSSKPFAVAVETPEGIETTGISPHGKEWERWVDALPEAQRNSLEKVAATFGPHVRVEGPKKVTEDVRQEIATMKASVASTADVSANTR